jgi:glycosyltransferase involved in cell wall biosynthesis
LKYGVVIPVHNEALYLERSVACFLQGLPSGICISELILVENGSKDNTLEVCFRLKQMFPNQIRVLSIERASYGEAVKLGMLECQCKYLSIMESDFLDTNFLSESIELFQSCQARFIVPSKRHPDSIDNRPMKRRLLTFAYN